MKICFFTPIFPPQYSGATFQAITLARELTKQGSKIVFLTLRNDIKRSKITSFLLESYEDFEVIVIPVSNLNKIIDGSCSNKDYIIIVLKLFFVSILNRHKYSIIHCHILGFPFTALSLIGRILGKKTIGKATMSNDFDFRKIGRISGFINKLFICSFNRIVVISNDIYSSIREENIPGRIIEYIPNAINTDIFFPVTSQSKSELKIKLGLNDEFVAIFVGGITYRKGVDKLIKIWVEFIKNINNAILILVGPRSPSEGAIGDEYCFDFVEQYIQEKNVTKRIIFTGRVENVSEYLQLSDLLVFPSTMEGMPNVVLEAMACGLPVISYRVSGIDDIIIDKRNGTIIEQGDLNNFRLAIDIIYSDKNLRLLYSKNAVKTINDHFSVKKIAQRYNSIYMEI